MNELLFDKVLKEHFDTSDRKSMKALLSLNEAEQNQAMVALAAKLYDKIIAKVDDIDFGTIPASRGDITKIGNFQELRDCLTTIREILVHYKQDTVQIDIIDKAIDNIRDSKAMWERAYAVGSEMPVVFYNTICLSIVSATSLLISSCIDFIKEPGNASFQVSFDRVAYNKTKDKLLFQNLEKFNKAFLKGDIQKTMDAVIKSTVNVKESGEEITESTALIALAATIASGVLVASLIGLIIPLLHELISLLYCARQDVADYFEVQAKVVQFNAEQLKYDYTKSEGEIKKIYDKQIKISDLFKKISNKLSVKMNKADNDAKALIKKDKAEKFKAEDLEMNDVPSMSSSIF